MASVTSAAKPVRSDSIFFPLMAVAIALTVFVGFAPTWFLKPMFAAPPLTPLRVLHGTAFTSWIVLLVVQTGFVAADRRDIHRKLGVVGACLAAVMVVLGMTLAVSLLRGDVVGPEPMPVPALFVLPLFDIILFSGFVTWGILRRADAAAHKRLMLLATITIVDAATARFLFWPVTAYGIMASFVLADLFVVALAIYDLATLKRIHRVTLWAGAIIILTGPLRLWLTGTAVWHALTGWLMS